MAELIHWLDDSQHPYEHVVYPGEYRWRDEDKETYVERVDGGDSWIARKSRYGRVATRANRYSKSGAIYQTAYSREQYQLVAWGIWMGEEHGWSDREVWEVLRYFWKLLPGQTPFVSRTVTAWRATRAKMRKKGLLWP